MHRHLVMKIFTLPSPISCIIYRPFFPIIIFLCLHRTLFSDLLKRKWLNLIYFHHTDLDPKFLLVINTFHTINCLEPFMVGGSWDWFNYFLSGIKCTLRESDRDDEDEEKGRWMCGNMFWSLYMISVWAEQDSKVLFIL